MQSALVKIEQRSTSSLHIAPKGYYRLIGLDISDMNEWFEGDFGSKRTAINLASKKVIKGVDMSVYDCRGICLHTGRFKCQNTMN